MQPSGDDTPGDDKQPAYREVVLALRIRLVPHPTMASSYVLSGASMSPPKTHLPGYMQHAHAHSHGHSHVPSPLGHGARPARSHRRTSHSSAVSLRGGNGYSLGQPYDFGGTASVQEHAHDHAHDHAHEHADEHHHDHASRSLPSHRPSTPVRSTFGAPSYAPPEASNVVFGQVAAPGSLSRFTEFLLQYTTQYPLVHAIMKEKDSRRIFYFMT